MDERYQVQILYVDDEEDILQQTKELLDGEIIPCNGQDFLLTIVTSPSFDTALDLLKTHRFDMLILDVRLGSRLGDRAEEAGEKVYQQIKQACFIPIVFYTGIPTRVSHLKSSFVHVVEKTQSTTGLKEAFTMILSTRIPEINRTLLKLFEDVKRDYMWKFVENHWQDFGDDSHYADLAYLLARRVAASLSDGAIGRLLEETNLNSTDNDVVHPLRYYVMPPVSPLPLAGDIYRESVNGMEKYFVVLTPSCDLYEKGDKRKHKADYVLLAQCKPLEQISEYNEYKLLLKSLDVSKGKAKDAKQKLLNILENKRDRFYYLPAAINLPDSVIDFQSLKTVAYSDVDVEQGCLKRVASLDSPYAEAVVTKFVHYFGRIGTPDLDVSANFSQLSE